MKELKDILLIFLSAFFIALFSAMLTHETAFATLPTIPSNTMTSFTFPAYTMIASSEHNTNNTDLKTGINETKQYLRDLETHIADRVDTATVTGAWSFTPAATFNGGVTFGGDDGVNNTSLLIDADNSGTEVDTKILFQRGSTATDSEIRWDSTDDRFELYTDGSVLSDLQIGNCDSTGEACNFDDVVLDTTNQTVAGIKTYSSAIVQSAECSASNELCTKSYIDMADSAITAGGCSYGSSVPVGVCSQGSCYNLLTSSGYINHYVCTSSGYVPVTNYLNSAVTFPQAITLSSSGQSISGSPTITGNVTVVGNFALSSSGFNASNVRLTNVANPTAEQDAVTLNYFNNNNSNFNPLNIAGLALWLKANSITGLNDGDVVTTWTDSSGLSESFTEATNKPTYKTNIINGYPVIRFDGTNDKLTSTSAISTFITNSAYTAFVVTKNPAAFNSGVTINSRANTDIIFSDSTTYNFALGVYEDSGSGRFTLLNYDGTLDAAEGSNSQSLSEAGLSILSHSGGFITYTDFDNNDTTVASGNTSTLTNTLKLGSNGTNFGEIDIAEIVIYNVALDTNSITKVKKYLKTKYNL